MIDLLGTGGMSSSLEAVSLSLDEMQLLIQILELDQLPTVLMVLGQYTDVDAQRQAMDAARESLTERGLLVGEKVHEDLEDRLRVLPRPHWVLAVRLYVGNSISRLCLAKGDDDRFVLVLRGSESFVVQEIAGSELVGPVMSALGAVEPLPLSSSINAPTEQLKEIFGQAGDPDVMGASLRKLGAAAAEAQTVGRAMVHCHARMEIVGVIYGEGKQEVSPTNIAVFDTHLGRMVITASIGGDDIKWSSINSGTPARLRKALAELIASLPDREEFPLQGF